jgi:hypothetical protein
MSIKVICFDDDIHTQIQWDEVHSSGYEEPNLGYNAAYSTENQVTI